jgi:DNA (cytosine-5)-methyltransferase 1
MTKMSPVVGSTRTRRRHDTALGAIEPGGDQPSGAYAVGELFCGAGGLSRGFHARGFAPLFANDVWDLAVHNFLMNFDPAYARTNGAAKGSVLGLPGSVEDIDPIAVMHQVRSPVGEAELAHGQLDTLLGGPPCQGFSVNSHIRSAADPRNHLFKHYVRILKALAPKVFVLENVPGMYSLEGGRFFDELLSEIGKLNSLEFGGYDISFKILNAAHYGVPQERFRLVVIGTRRDVADEVGKVELPEPMHYSLAQAHFKGGRSQTFHYAIGHRRIDGEIPNPAKEDVLLPPVSVGAAIDDLPALSNGGGIDGPVSYGRGAVRSDFSARMRAGARRLANHWSRELLPPNTERVKFIPEGGDWRSIPHELLPPGMQRALRKDHTTRYGRLRRDHIAGTILTKPDPHWGTFIHPDVDQQRLISVREAARFQSFPDAHTFYGAQVDQYRLCGNAVPPLMAEVLAQNVRAVLDAYHRRESDVGAQANLPIAVNV